MLTKLIVVSQTIMDGWFQLVTEIAQSNTVCHALLMLVNRLTWRSLWILHCKWKIDNFQTYLLLSRSRLKHFQGIMEKKKKKNFVRITAKILTPNSTAEDRFWRWYCRFVSCNVSKQKKQQKSTGVHGGKSLTQRFISQLVKKYELCSTTSDPVICEGKGAPHVVIYDFCCFLGKFR